MARPPKRPPARPSRGKPTAPPRAPRGRQGAAAKTPAAGPARAQAARPKSPPKNALTPKIRPPAETRSQPPARPPAARPGTRAKGLWLFGRHAVLAALQNPRRSCHRLLATGEAFAKLDQPVRPDIEVRTVERAEIDRLLGPATVHQGLALSVAPLPGQDLERVCAPEPGRNLVLVLDQVSDPHNVGAILRSAAAFDVRAVIVQTRRSAELGGACAKAAAGALDRVPVVEVTNLTRTLETLAELGYWRIGLDASATTPIEDVPPADDVVFVLGAEGSGLRRLVAETCDLLTKLPISAGSESLNVSVATGIALYAWRQRQGKVPGD